MYLISELYITLVIICPAGIIKGDPLKPQTGIRRLPIFLKNFIFSDPVYISNFYGVGIL